MTGHIPGIPSRTAAAAIVATLLFASPHIAAHASYLTAEALMEVQDEQRDMFIAGVVAGLSTARFVKDGGDAGSGCIDRWFYESDEAKSQIDAAFRKFSDKSPSAIIYALVSKVCGK